MPPVNPTSFTMPDMPLRPSAGTHPDSAAHMKPVVVGLYGLPGAGKTYLLKQLKEMLKKEDFSLYEGSEQIDTVVDGGLEAFKKMTDDEKVHWRELAIGKIGEDSARSGRTALVTGHFMFWSKEEKTGTVAWTQKDLDTYTHILYLDVPPQQIQDRSTGDKERARLPVSTETLGKWQETEKTELRQLCRQHGILFCLMYLTALPPRFTYLLRDFRVHDEDHNSYAAKDHIEEILKARQGHLDTMLVIDADKTLTAEDTGALFWKAVSEYTKVPSKTDTLKDLFSSKLGYSYTAFRQATLLSEEAVDDNVYDVLCGKVASAVTVHPEFIHLLQLVSKQEQLGATVITCGPRLIWEKILQRLRLDDKVKVIGGGRIADDYVVTAAVKGQLVGYLQKAHRLRVWAFGDSPLDLPMLSQADQAIVVTGEEQTRSKSMDPALASALGRRLRARQVLLPAGTAEPRLDLTKLPAIKLDDPTSFLKPLLTGHFTVHDGGLEVICAAETNGNAANLLATPMRDAANAGPTLRTAHRHVGWYLAVEHVTVIVGLEDRPIQHVLGRRETGSRLRHEEGTTIVALMRGGEPMASGVSDAFPLAWFLHAKEAEEDIKLHHLRGQQTVILVDSVVNTGKTIIDAVRHVRTLHATVRIVVVAGVVQKGCVAQAVLRDGLAGLMGIHLVTLRYSDTKFTGSKATDTGNRLFNTIHLD